MPALQQEVSRLIHIDPVPRGGTAVGIHLLKPHHLAIHVMLLHEMPLRGCLGPAALRRILPLLIDVVRLEYLGRPPLLRRCVDDQG